MTKPAKGAPGIKFVVSYGYSVAYGPRRLPLPLKAVCRTSARWRHLLVNIGEWDRSPQTLFPGRSSAQRFSGRQDGY
jgi:hypothetical protein